MTRPFAPRIWGRRIEVDVSKENPYIAGMISSTLSQKAQTTIPKAVRAALDLREGDEIGYVIEGSRVIMMRVSDLRDDPFSTFGEWAGQADTEAYGGL